MLQLLVRLSRANYILTLSWPPTSCLDKACSHLEHWSASAFNLHGLWMQDPSTCKNI
jgi:ribonuclease I